MCVFGIWSKRISAQGHIRPNLFRPKNDFGPKMVNSARERSRAKPRTGIQWHFPIGYGTKVSHCVDVELLVGLALLKPSSSKTTTTPNLMRGPWPKSTPTSLPQHTNNQDVRSTVIIATDNTYYNYRTPSRTRAQHIQDRQKLHIYRRNRLGQGVNIDVRRPNRENRKEEERFYRSSRCIVQRELSPEQPRGMECRIYMKVLQNDK